MLISTEISSGAGDHERRACKFFERREYRFHLTGPDGPAQRSAEPVVIRA
jgi:hypothetical protein